MRAALAMHGLELDPRHVRYAPISLAAAAAATQDMLALATPPTAVVATNDVFAVGGMIACRELGVRIPEDISVTGVDNTDLGATQTPALTSIRTPIVEIGGAAAEQLIARLEGRDHVAFQLLPFELVPRASTSAPPRLRRSA